jgi:hypothetical protein
MGQEAGILIVTIWLTSAATLFAESSPSQTILPKTALNAGQASVQIDLGDLYLEERNFKEADAAYIRALQSEDSTIRERALMALEKSLHEEHNYVSWIIKTAQDFWEQAIHQSTLFTGPVILAIAAWFGLGWIGDKKGAKRCVIRATNQGDPDLANVFRLAYLTVLTEQERRRSGSGPIGTSPMTPTLESGTSEALLPQLVSITNEKAGKIVAIFSGRLNRPRYRLSVSTVGDEYEKRLVVSLEAKGKIVEVWNQEMPASELFEADCRFLRKIVAYVDGYAGATK